MIHTIDISTMRGKRIMLIHWASCTLDAHTIRQVLLPIARHIDTLLVGTHQQLRQTVFSELTNYDVVLLFGHENATNKCMTVQLRGREQSYLVKML
jgi:hypothetical protein